jgi:signal peptidase I
MNIVSQLTEALANLSIKMVLLAVASMMLALAAIRVTANRRDRNALWWMENIQVVLSVVVVVFLFIRPYLFQAFYIPSSSMEPTLKGPAPGQTSGDRLLVNKLIYKFWNPQIGDICVFKAPPSANAEEKEFIKRVMATPGDTIAVLGPRLKVDGKTAVSLSTNEGGNGIDVTSQDQKKIAVQANRTNLPTSLDGTIKVIVDPDPREEVRSNEVKVNGVVELEDREGGIRAQAGLLTYGGDGKLQGNVYLVDEEPRLIVIKGNSLEYEPGHVEINGRKRPEPYLAENPDYTMEPKKMGPGEYFMLGDNRNNSNDSHHWGVLTRDRVIGRAEILFWPLDRFKVFQYWLLAFFAIVFVAYNLFQRSLPPR